MMELSEEAKIWMKQGEERITSCRKGSESYRVGGGKIQSTNKGTGRAIPVPKEIGKAESKTDTSNRKRNGKGKKRVGVEK